MSKIPTAEVFLHHDGFDMIFDGDKITEKMIEFAKLHVDNIRAIQQSKYFAGETGYITNEEWINILENIK